MRGCTAVELDGSASRLDAAHSCPAPDEAHRFAVLGIFSIDAHAAARRIIRETWLNESAILSRFVLHGLGALESSIHEAALRNDIVFLNAPAVMSCKAGPLRKLWLWLECATFAWPKASFVGKADDDAWVHLPSVALSVRSTLQAIGSQQVGAAERLYWGQFESYCWHAGFHRPVAFGGLRFTFRRLPAGAGPSHGRLEWCLRRREPDLARRVKPRRPLPSDASTDTWPRDYLAQWWKEPQWLNGTLADRPVIGPFPFAKGPLYLLSTPLASAVLADRWVRAHAEATLASAGGDEAVRAEETWPWEDVFLGMALAMTAATSGLVVVEAGRERFSGESSRLEVAPSSQLYAP